MDELIQETDFEAMAEGVICEATEFVLPTDPAYLLTGAEIYMDWRKKPGQVPVAKFSLGRGFTVTGDYTFRFDRQVITAPADTYLYDILILFVRNGVKEPDRLIKGKVPITPTITHHKS